MKILHVTSIANSDGNGVAVAVKNYVKYESQKAYVALYNLESDLNDTACNNYNYRDYKCISELPEPFSNPDIVIFNEVYKTKYIELYRECIMKNIKYIIIPHGCLVKEAQKKHKIKKIIGNTLLFNKFIKKANAIQFLNESEKSNSNFKYKKFILAGNGVEKPSFKNNIIKENGSKDIVFIGRYNIKVKGLDLLCEVCKNNYKWFIEQNVRIMLYGRDTLNNLIKLKKCVEKTKIDDIFVINDAVYNNKKEEVLKKAYAFIQCSRHEGQPMGILEALSVGLPCVVTYGTSLGEYVENNKCGIACDFNSSDVFKAISKIVDDVKLRDEFAYNSYEKSNIDFCWNNVIEKTIDEYRKI